MKYFGTNFTLTLGAWRLRFLIAIEDEPDDRTAAMSHIHRHAERTRAASHGG